MSNETISIDAAQRHVEKDLTADWLAVRSNGETLVVNHAGEGLTVYEVTGTSNNARVLAQADAIIYNGYVGLTNYKPEGLVTIQHRYAGIQDRIVASEMLDDPVPILERTELVTLEGETDE